MNVGAVLITGLDLKVLKNEIDRFCQLQFNKFDEEQERIEALFNKFKQQKFLNNADFMTFHKLFCVRIPYFDPKIREIACMLKDTEYNKRYDELYECSERITHSLLRCSGLFSAAPAEIEEASSVPSRKRKASATAPDAKEEATAPDAKEEATASVGSSSGGSRKKPKITSDTIIRNVKSLDSVYIVPGKKRSEPKIVVQGKSNQLEIWINQKGEIETKVQRGQNNYPQDYNVKVPQYGKYGNKDDKESNMKIAGQARRKQFAQLCSHKENLDEISRFVPRYLQPELKIILIEWSKFVILS